MTGRPCAPHSEHAARRTPESMKKLGAAGGRWVLHCSIETHQPGLYHTFAPCRACIVKGGRDAYRSSDSHGVYLQMGS